MILRTEAKGRGTQPVFDSQAECQDELRMLLKNVIKHRP